jgi:hypothetical protein
VLVNSAGEMDILLILIFCVGFSFQQQPPHNHDPHTQHFPKFHHLVFIGDSLLRYSYLDFVYRLHFHQTPPVDLITNDRSGSQSQKWEDYLLYSTEIFQGSMICDCFRSNSQNVPDKISEIRYYSHPSKQIYVSFYLKFGHYPIFGKPNHSDAKVYSSFDECRFNSWQVNNYQDLINQIKLLSPKPTVILLNERFWLTPFQKTITEIISELPDLIRSLFQFVDYVLWLEGTPTLKESLTFKQEKPNPTDDFMKTILCNSSHPLARSIALASPSPSSDLNRKYKFCYFVPFPSQLRAEISGRISPPLPVGATTTTTATATAEYYSDHYHFKNSTVYQIRIKSALETIGLSYLTKRNTFLEKKKN